ncbi:hypothetical protein STCU_06220 [Strigomonas culicis]|nr:hypothetical protein STCU_06220 [Strigomonas culicis]|eukprot:EPY26301.1 hypothetical protein STCU_06220 [Strigomonas culicis]
MSEMMGFLNGYEIGLSILTVVVVLVYGVERYHTVQMMLREKRERIRRMDEELPPPMPMKVDPELQGRYNERPEKEALERDAHRIVEESRYRRKTQRKFEDFREFLFVQDPDGATERRVTFSRFSYQYLTESEIPKKCPILKHINSERKHEGYDSIQRELGEALEATPWVSPDAGYAGRLVAQGLGCVAANAPGTSKWTFIEYVDETKGKKNAQPMCLAAILNHRFEQIGMCQRVIISGKENLKPELAKQREEDLQSGVLRKRKLVQGGTLKVKDLSIPLQQMKL